MDQLNPNEQELTLDSAPEAPEELEICPPESPVEEAAAADTDMPIETLTMEMLPELVGSLREEDLLVPFSAEKGLGKEQLLAAIAASAQ